MKSLRFRWPVFAFVIGLFTALLPGCVVTDGRYGYPEDVGVGVDYYEPYGAVYGGWAPGYYVGPPRHFEGRREHEERRPERGDHAPVHAYRAAPPSHAIPSIPSHSRSRGERSH